MISLSETNESFQLVTTTAAPLDIIIEYADAEVAAGDVTKAADDSHELTLSAAGTSEILAAPAANIRRGIKYLSIRNKSNSLANKVRLVKDKAATDRDLTPDITLGVGEMLFYTIDAGFRVMDANGVLRVAPSAKAGAKGTPFTVFKVGTAPEAVGVWYSFAKDTGFPGVWVPGTPGLAGRITDGTSAADNGCLKIPNAVAGANFLTDWQVEGMSQVGAPTLFDLLWVNSGLVGTTVTAQTVNSVSLPARDNNGSANGEECMIGILITTATTNAAVVANMTVTYTNSAGVAGRTATMASFPATAVLGTVMFFQLAAGDTGVQSIQAVTLGTSLGVAAPGTLFIARKIVSATVMAAGQPGAPKPLPEPGIRLWNNTCMLPFYLPGSAAAAVLHGTATVIEKTA